MTTIFEQFLNIETEPNNGSLTNVHLNDIKKKLANTSVYEHFKWIDIYKSICIEDRELLRKYYTNRLKKQLTFGDITDGTHTSSFNRVWQYYQPLQYRPVQTVFLELISTQLNETSLINLKIIKHITGVIYGLDFTASFAKSLADTLIDALITKSVNSETKTKISHNSPIHNFWYSRINSVGDGKTRAENTTTILYNLIPMFELLINKMTPEDKNATQLIVISLSDQTYHLKKSPLLKKYVTPLSFLDRDTPINDYLNIINTITKPDMVNEEIKLEYNVCY